MAFARHLQDGYGDNSPKPTFDTATDPVLDLASSSARYAEASSHAQRTRGESGVPGGLGMIAANHQPALERPLSCFSVPVAVDLLCELRKLGLFHLG